MTKLQRFTIIIGCSSILLNLIAICERSSRLGFIALMLARLSGFMYLTAVDRFRPIYGVPLVFASANTIINSQYLIFAEMLCQQVIYQIAAYRLFTDGNLKRYANK